ncbi:MAG: urease accessory protein UreE [Gammaproteobacteria bacterium]|nr:MAG: urease accessory protein UreE [Gammaproteobacteria bacterium]
MWKIHQRLSGEQAQLIHDEVILDHLQRERGRFKAIATSGTEVRVFLERGNPLSIGDVLRSHCGKNIAVIGALEAVAIASTENWQQFSKACYHLGNRHTKLQMGERWLRFTPDHVLEELVQKFGLSIRHEKVVFEPEPGAYVRRASFGAQAESQHGHHHH